ncbi:hypothetical protein BDZ97DRAFT_1926533 [Flammula alnicola]|nr:hypothetical protein BDZ97DRAFT_1926533 [Flammula alnicola]
MESMMLAPVQQELESIKQEFSIFKDWITTSERNQKQLLDEFKNSIHQQTRMAQQMPPPQPAPMRMYQPPLPPMMRYQPPEAPRNCFYCHMTGHMYRDCPVCQAHLNTGKVNLGEGGKLYFPDGRMISFDPNRPVKDRVDEWHAKQKTDVAFQSWETESVPGIYHLQAHQGSMSIYANQQRDQRDEVIEKLRQELQGRPGPSYQLTPVGGNTRIRGNPSNRGAGALDGGAGSSPPSPPLPRPALSPSSVWYPSSGSRAAAPPTSPSLWYPSNSSRTAVAPTSPLSIQAAAAMLLCSHLGGRGGEALKHGFEHRLHKTNIVCMRRTSSA